MHPRTSLLSQHFFDTAHLFFSRIHIQPLKLFFSPLHTGPKLARAFSANFSFSFHTEKKFYYQKSENSSNPSVEPKERDALTARAAQRARQHRLIYIKIE
jgi:hypothetical protein